VIKCRHLIQEGVDWSEAQRVAQHRGWLDSLYAAALILAYAETAVFGNSLVPAEFRNQALRSVPSWSHSWLRAHSPAVPAVPINQEADSAALLPLRIPFGFSKRFSYAKLIRDPSRSVPCRLRDVILHTSYGIKLRLHIHSQPSMLITISGVDGCGKTTQARALLSACHTCLLKADYVWYRGGSAGWLAFLTRRLQPRRGHQASRPADTRILDRQTRLRSPWRRLAWAWLTTFELLLRYTWSVTLPLWTGKIVICDRYVDDALADWSAYFADESVASSLPARLLRRLTPKPSFSYWLDVPANVAQRRSADQLPTFFLEALSGAYRRQSESAPAGQNGLRRVDGTLGWEDISQHITGEVLSRYFADYHTVINALFLKNPGQWR